VSSGVLPLSLTASSPGLQLLFRYLSAEASQLGYLSPTAPPDFDYGGIYFSGCQQLTPWGQNTSEEELAAIGLDKVFSQEPALQHERTKRPVFSATAEEDGKPLREVILKFYQGARDEVSAHLCSTCVPHQCDLWAVVQLRVQVADNIEGTCSGVFLHGSLASLHAYWPVQADLIDSLSHIPFVPRVVVAGSGPGDWPLFLAITPRAVHYSALEHTPAVLLAGMRDLALALRQIMQAGLLHGDVTPGNAMLAEGADGQPQLLLTDFHGAAQLGSTGMPTTARYSALGLSCGEVPSLATDLEAAFYTFLHIATREGLMWRHVPR
jgi:hypothetical protein